MKVWFNNLAQREQRLVSAMMGTMILALVYFLLIQPLQERLDKAKRSVERQQKLLSWVEQNATKLMKLRGNSGVQATGTGSIEQRINRSARQHQIIVNRLQPQNDKMQIMIDNAPYHKILMWLQTLQLQQGLTIEIADMRSEEKSGYVKTRIVVSQ